MAKEKFERTKPHASMRQQSVTMLMWTALDTPTM